MDFMSISNEVDGTGGTQAVTVKTKAPVAKPVRRVAPHNRVVHQVAKQKAAKAPAGIASTISGLFASPWTWAVVIGGGYLLLRKRL